VEAGLFACHLLPDVPKILTIYRERSETEPYTAALRAAGLEPVLVSADDPAATSLDGIDGLLLMGGSDVNPALFGQSPAPETEEPDPQLDAAECAAIAAAIARDIPILGICRGLQILNVQQGGTLTQHLPTFERHRRRPPNRALPAHSVSIVPGSQLASIADPALTWEVNSRHHQGIAALATSLKVSAVDNEDKTIEAVERPGSRFVVAVQWHPENQAPVNSEQARLFQAFAEACLNGPSAHVRAVT
jgi:putative glutamine amidotransferase